ncbi:MAG: DUF5615 family PIN-like protein [Phycisphaerales bacterium]|nr:DUF5615 family PIN-like protein [Phycisphaerales bacterium]
MPIRFKIDEDLPREVAETLRRVGHDARSVVEQSLAGSPDATLWDIVQREVRCLVTADKGFANAILHPPGSHAGVILLRLPRESRRGYIALVERLTVTFPLEAATGGILVVTPDSIRIHRRT